MCACLTGVHQAGRLQDEEGLQVGGQLPSLLLPAQGQEGRRAPGCNQRPSAYRQGEQVAVRLRRNHATGQRSAEVHLFKYYILKPPAWTRPPHSVAE